MHTKFDIYVLFDMIMFINSHTGLQRYIHRTIAPLILIRTDIIDLRLIIITYNRPWSLQRLLTSFNEAEYFNDMVVIAIWIDRSKYGTIDDKTYQVATHFKLDKGDINVMNHTDHVGR